MRPKYVESFAEPDHAAQWDTAVYGEGTYDSFIWGLQQVHVLKVAEGLAAANGSVKHFDFACGTGRVLAAAAPIATESHGVDISEAMVAIAQDKIDRGRVVAANILEDPSAADDDYDLITSFRFFLNTEPELRGPIMDSLAGRLAGPESRLIFNVHGNASSVLSLNSLVPGASESRNAKTMTVAETKRLINDAKLEVVSMHGFGMLPKRAYESPAKRIIGGVDSWAANRSWLTRWSRDILYVCKRR